MSDQSHMLRQKLSYVQTGSSNRCREERGSGTDQIRARKLGATSLVLVPRVDTCTQGVDQKKADQQDDRQKLIATFVRTVLSAPGKDKLI